MKLRVPRAPIEVPGVRAGLAVAQVGFVAIAVSWWQVSGEPIASKQAGWLNFGVLGVGAVAFGSLVAVSAIRRAVDDRIVAVADVLEARGPAVAGAAQVVAAVDRVYRAVPGGGRYHRAECMFVQSRRTRAVLAGSRSLARLAPCELCDP